MGRDSLDKKLALWEKHCVFNGFEEGLAHIEDIEDILSNSAKFKNYFLVMNDFLTENSVLHTALKSTVLIHPNDLDKSFTGVVIKYGAVRLLVTAMHCLDYQNPDFVDPPDNLCNVSRLDDQQEERVILEIGRDTFTRNALPLNSLRVLAANPTADYVVFEYTGEIDGIGLEYSEPSWPAKCLHFGFPKKYSTKWQEIQKPLISAGLCSRSGYAGNFGPDFDEGNPYKLLYTGRVEGGCSGGPIISESGTLIAIVSATPILGEDYPIYHHCAVIKNDIQELVGRM